MAQNSKIEWCDHTVNLWWGCTKVHEGCDNCYAEYFSDVRYKNDLWGNGKARKMIKSAFPSLEKYQKLAKETGEIHRVFVGSMMDIFEKPMPILDKSQLTTDDLRFELFFNIDLDKYPNLLFLFLTKRPSNINKYIPENWKRNPPENVMFGCSVVNQKTANTLIPQLLEVNGKTFLSIEPQLDSIDLLELNKHSNKQINCLSGAIVNSYDGFGYNIGYAGKIDWVIQGGESGPKRRPFKLDWAYDLKKQCEQFKTPYFFKQIDKVLPIPDDLLIRQFPE